MLGLLLRHSLPASCPLSFVASHLGPLCCSEDLSVVAAGVTRGFPFAPSLRVVAGTPLVARTVPHVSYELSWRSNGAPRTTAAEVYFPRNEFCGTKGSPSIEASPSLNCGFQDAYTLTCNQTAIAESTLSVRLHCFDRAHF